MAPKKDTVLKRHEPPGNLPDLTEPNKEKWSKEFISTWMQGEIDAVPNIVGKGRTPLPQFFDGTKTPFNQGDSPKTVEWNAFPKVVSSNSLFGTTCALTRYRSEVHIRAMPCGGRLQILLV